MLNFVTLFDKNYLTRGLTLYDSLLKNCSTKFTLYILSMDKETEIYFRQKKLKNIVVESVDDLKIMYPVLKRLEQERTRGEFSWTLSAFSIQYTIKHFKLDSCIYVDSDICFFNDPKLLLKNIGKKSVLITEHNYTPKYDQTATSGKFCVQFMYFKNDKGGNKVLEWWRKSCEKWCYNRIEDGKFGDQKYLDDWESRFEKQVYNCKELGCGIAPWNVQKFDIFFENNKLIVEDKISKQRDNLIFYHFHALKQLEEYRWNLSSYDLTNDIKENIYKPYIDMLVSRNESLPLELQTLFVKQDQKKEHKGFFTELRAFFSYVKHYRSFRLKQIQNKEKEDENKYYVISKK